MPLDPTPFTYRVPATTPPKPTPAHCADALDALIHAEGPETVLAFIMEPIGGLATGALVPPDPYFRAVRDICTRHGVKLIFDEVISGGGPHRRASWPPTTGRSASPTWSCSRRA